MKNIINLYNADGIIPELCGNKASSLAKIINKGIKVPKGICLTGNAYKQFVKANGIDHDIIAEFSRKNFKDMRWEELWDTALRIRNIFSKASIPKNIEQEILYNIKNEFNGKALAIRSSSLAEDSPNASFAGIHESFVNVSSIDSILQSIKLVWASLWSDAALLYREELSLSFEESAMGVVIQEMIHGDISGISFCQSPNNKDEAVIESIYGLNKGLVDGDIEPDRYIIDRTDKSIKSITKANHIRKVSPKKDGVEFTDIENPDKETLNEQQINNIYSLMEDLEILFKYPQDIEWTIKDNEIFILQSRPITTNTDEEKQWYLSLKRSFDNLEKLAHRVENEILPQMEEEAVLTAKTNLTSLSTDELIEEIEKRNVQFNKWNDIYWHECIPFAHGVRLFASVYNDKMQPDDAFEFIDLILPSDLKSTSRNSLIEDASLYINEHPESISTNGKIVDDTLKNKVNTIAQEIGITYSETTDKESEDIIKLIKETSKGKVFLIHEEKTKEMEQAFLSKFPPSEESYAKKLLWLARKSYQLRDDDNIYLGKLNTNISLALKEANKRIHFDCEDVDLYQNIEETIKALRFPEYIPHLTHRNNKEKKEIVINMRQLRGQPACKGIAKGKARVIKSVDDLFKIKKDEIIVCDAIDPTMTFVIPITSAIVERRGGMLIHGAIIAREYGIPCVTGIPNATELIKDGDNITVDGYYGLVINHSRTFK